MSIINQLIGTFVICSLSFNLGLVYTWPSGIISTFVSNNTTLDRPMTVSEINLLGSLSSLAPLISTPLAGYFTDVIGRKNVAVVTSTLPVICWTLIGLFSKVEVILTAMFIGGMGGAALIVTPIYIGEICQESIRGAMAAFTMIFYAVGMMTSYILAQAEYRINIYTNLSLSAIGVIAILVILKETPVFLMEKGLHKESARILAYYRKAKIDSKEVLTELEALRRSLSPHNKLLEISPEHEKLAAHEIEDKATKNTTWQYLKKFPSGRRGLFLGTMVMVLGILQGLPALQVYADLLFKKAVPNLSSTLCASIMAILTIICGVLAGFLADKVGRRPLIIYASLANGIFSILLGTQLQLQWAEQWATVIFIYFYTASFTFGAGTVPYILVSEMYIPEVKTTMSMIVIQLGWVVTFLVVFIYQPIEIYLGPGRVFYFFSVCSLLLALFAKLFLPETKGLAVDVIQELLDSSKDEQKLRRLSFLKRRMSVY